MGIPVKLSAFEGPLDLLLHLIDKNKINIYDIPIAEITDQYMEYMKELDTKDMDVMSEFLVMAATLLNIKSRMLLPVEETKQEENEDPRKELVERLLEYKMYQYISYELKDKQKEAEKVLYKEPCIPEEIVKKKDKVPLEELLSDLTLAKLHAIYRSIIKRQSEKIDPVRSKFGKIEKEEISLKDALFSLQQYLKRHPRFRFREVFEKPTTKVHIIVTFLAILELMKIGQITIHQPHIFDDITITRNEKASIEEVFLEEVR